MLSASRLHYLYLAYCSRPQSDRTLYRAIKRQGWRRFLEIGIGHGRRAERMLRLALSQHAADQVRYVGIDLFEARELPDSGLTLKTAHASFKAKGLPAQFIPGDPLSALARSANALRDIDAVVISSDQDADSLARAWFYLPRVLHATSVVFIEQVQADGTPKLVQIARAEVEARARRPQRRAA